MLLTLRPECPLSTVVDCIWHHAGAQAVNGREHVLPDGRFQIVLNLAAGKGTVCGLRSQHVVIDTAQIPWMMGVVLRSGGALAFLGASALEFWNQSVALDLVWGRGHSNSRTTTMQHRQVNGCASWRQPSPTECGGAEKQPYILPSTTRFTYSTMLLTAAQWPT